MRKNNREETGIREISLENLRIHPKNNPYYQSIFAIYENTKQLHLHMVINNVPLIDKAGTLTHHIDRLWMEFMANCIIDEYWSYYLTHSYYSKPNTIQMVKDAIAHHGAYIKRDIKKDPQI